MQSRIIFIVIVLATNAVAQLNERAPVGGYPTTSQPYGRLQSWVDANQTAPIGVVPNRTAPNTRPLQNNVVPSRAALNVVGAGRALRPVASAASNDRRTQAGKVGQIVGSQTPSGQRQSQSQIQNQHKNQGVRSAVGFQDVDSAPPAGNNTILRRLGLVEDRAGHFALTGGEFDIPEAPGATFPPPEPEQLPIAYEDTNGRFRRAANSDFAPSRLPAPPLEIPAIAANPPRSILPWRTVATNAAESSARSLPTLNRPIVEQSNDLPSSQERPGPQFRIAQADVPVEVLPIPRAIADVSSDDLVPKLVQGDEIPTRSVLGDASSKSFDRDERSDFLPPAASPLGIDQSIDQSTIEQSITGQNFTGQNFNGQTLNDQPFGGQVFSGQTINGQPIENRPPSNPSFNDQSSKRPAYGSSLETSTNRSFPSGAFPPRDSLSLPFSMPSSSALTSPLDDSPLDDSPMDDLSTVPARPLLEPEGRPLDSGPLDSSLLDELPPNATKDGEAASDDLPPADKKLSERERELMLQSARNATRMKKYAVASERFAEYLRLFPDDGQARLEFAGLLSVSGRYDAASSQIEHLIRQFPSDFRFHRRFADLQLQVSNYAGAEASLRQLIQHPDYRVDAAIDLARSYAWANRTRDAIAVYEQYLQSEYPNTAEQQLRFAELLTEINVPGRALELLLQLHARRPLDLKILKLIILASSRAGNTQATFEYINQLQSTRPENVSLRHELAKQLHGEGFYREGMMIDQQVLSFDPSSKDALLRTAQANLRLYETTSARATLSNIVGSENDPTYLAALAEYHSRVGEHADAIAAYRRLIAENPGFANARIGLGHAYLRSGQFLRAGTEFGKVQGGTDPAANQMRLEAQLSLARALAEARQFDEATAVIEANSGVQNQQDVDAVLDAYIDVLSKARQFTSAAEAARAGLADALGRPRREAALRAKLGLMLSRAGDHSGALQEFTALEPSLEEPLPEVVYGKYRSLSLLGNADAARQELTRHFGLLASDTYLRVRVAEMATEDCDCCLARHVLSHLERFCNNNPIVGNRLGEACLQCSACENVGDCAGHFVNVLNQSPSNVQAMLGLARMHSRSGSNQEAIALYERAVRHMPDNPNLLREVARLMNQWRGPGAASEYYNRAMQLSSGDHLFGMAQSSPERIAELEQEYESLSVISSLVATEMSAKNLSVWQPVSAISTFEGLMALEPSNQDALFEIGQSFSKLNRTSCAIEQYERLLCLNPCHQEARIALDRARLEMSPQMMLFGGIRSQRGRDNLTAIDEQSAGVAMQIPLGDEDEYFRLGYSRTTLDAPNSPSIDGDTPFVRMQFKPIWPVLAWAQLNYETFDAGFDDRITFDIGFEHLYVENASYRLIGRQQNVIENIDSVRSDIYRTGIEIGHKWQPSQVFEVDMLYRYWNYSDSNNSHVAGVYTGYTLLRGRKQLRWLTDFDYITFENPNVFPINPTLGPVHPYFAPRDFWFASAGIEWRHYLSCNTFKGANLHWYELYAGARIDSEQTGYGLARGKLVRDIRNWMSLSAYGEIIRSTEYDLTEAGVNLTVRF